MKHKKFALLYSFIFVIAAANYWSGQYNIVARTFIQGFILVIIPVLLAYHFKFRGKDFGYSIKEWKKILLYSGILILIGIPGMIWAARMPVFQAYYPIFNAWNWASFALFELLLLPAFYFLEFFYRGFALFMMKKQVGNWAILLQAIPYMLIHWGKPFPELVYSLFAGMAFAYFCLRAKSFLPAFIGHYTTSVIFDVMTF